MLEINDRILKSNIKSDYKHVFNYVDVKVEYKLIIDNIKKI